MAYEIVAGRSPKEKERLGLAGTIFLGKHYVQMERIMALSNPVYLDVSGPHVVLLSGKRGSGKCLHGDTLITLDNGSVVPIKDLANDSRGVFGLDHKLKIKKISKTEFFSRKVDRLLKIKLRSGKEIELTPEHPLLTIRGWQPAQELNVGSRIATPRIIGADGNTELEDHRIKLLAYLLAEGHLSNNFVLFSNSDEKIIKDFFESVNKFDAGLKIEQHSKPFCYRVAQKNVKHEVSNIKRNEKGQIISTEHKRSKTSLRAWLEEIGVYGKLSKEKHIPEQIFGIKKDKLALFLNILFSCDGSVYKHAAWEISYASSSEKLIRQVQHLLLRFGVLSRLRTKKTKCNGKLFETFELEICGENLIKFIENIGFFGCKEKRQEIALQEVSATKRNPNVDTIPKEMWEFYKPKSWAEVGRALGYTTFPKAARESQFYSPSRHKLLQIAVADGAENIKTLAEADIFWDEIISMELLDGEFEVYDISVPEFHNFIANDIIVHNSYSIGVIAEGLADLPEDIKNNLSFLIFDTMGIFWTMKYPNYKDDALLHEWNLQPKGLQPVVFVPFGLFDDYQSKGVPVDLPFSIRPAEVSATEWTEIFGLDLLSEAGILLERAVEKARQNFENFEIDELINLIDIDKDAEKREKQILKNRLAVAKTWGIFKAEGTEILDLFKGGTTSILDLSAYAQMENSDRLKALVIGLVSKKILAQRMESRRAEEVKLISEGGFLFGEKSAIAEKGAPLVWLMIDEAHEFLPRVGKTLASNALIQILREGRQPGISLVLATQQPGKIHTDVMTQADVVLSHRVTSKIDTTALNEISATYLAFDIQKYIDELPADKGTAILLDDKLEKIYPMRVRPRYSWHGGEDPTAIKGELKALGVI